MIEGTLTELSTKLKFANAPLSKKRQILIDIHGARCFYCGATPDYFEIDHVHPKSRGGTDELTNLVLSCMDCNQRKGGCGVNDMHSQPKELKEAVLRTLRYLSPFSNRKFTYSQSGMYFHLNGDMPIKQPSEITEFGELLEQHRIQSGLSKKGILKRLNSFEKKWNNYLTNQAMFGESQLPRLAKLLSIPLQTLESAYIKDLFEYALERPLLSQVWKKPFLQAFIESCDIENRIHAFLREYPEKIKSIHPCHRVIQNLKIGRPPGKRGRDRIQKMLGFEVFPVAKIEAFRSQLRSEPPSLNGNVIIPKKNASVAHHNGNGYHAGNGKPASTPPIWVAESIISESDLRKKLRQEFDDIIEHGDIIKASLSSCEINFVFQPLFSNLTVLIRKFVDGRSFSTVARELGVSVSPITSYFYRESFPSRKMAALLKEKAGIDVFHPSVIQSCYDLIDTIPMTNRGDIRVESIHRLKKEGLFYSEGAVNFSSILKGRAIFASWESGKPVPARLKKRWTDAEIDQLRELVGAGKKDTEIADILGRPINSIRKKRVRELGVFRKIGRPRKKSKRWTTSEEARLRQLFEAGKSDAEIGSILGRTQDSVRHRRKQKLGIDIRIHWSADEDARLEELLTTTDKPLSEIAMLMDRSEGSIERRKERLGIRRVPFKLDRFNPTHVAQLLKFKAAGWTHEQIAEVWGIKNPTQISHVLVSHGFHRFCACIGEKTYVRWSETELDTLRDCVKEELSAEEIQDRLPNRSIPAIKKRIKRLQKLEIYEEPIQVERKSWQPQVTVTRNMSVREMRDDAELTIDEIAEITGKSRVEVFKELSGGS